MIHRVVFLIATVSARYCPQKSFLQIAEGPKDAKVEGDVKAMIPFDGYFEVGCFIDNTDESLWVKYKETLKKNQKQPAPLTPSVCFNFCRGIPKMKFFGLIYGTDCYCAPYATLSAGEGGNGECTSPCGGDNNFMCGDNKGKSNVYEMHRCGDVTEDAQKDYDAANESREKANALVQQVTLAIDAVTSVAQKINVTENRKLILDELNKINQLVHDTQNQLEPLSKLLEALDAAIKGFSADNASAEEMAKLEKAQGLVNAAEGAMNKTSLSLKEYWIGHSILAALKFHGVNAEELLKSTSPISEDFQRLPVKVSKQLQSKELAVKGYFAVGEHLTSLYYSHDGAVPEWKDGAKRMCYNACMVNVGCVAANLFGETQTEGHAFICNLKKSVKKVQLMGTVEDSQILTGFIFNTYFGLHAKKDIEWNTANLL